jgi:putative transposase
MPRVARFIIDDAIFHILNRGNGRQEIFHQPEDFEYFLFILAYYKAKYDFRL